MRGCIFATLAAIRMASHGMINCGRCQLWACPPPAVATDRIRMTPHKTTILNKRLRVLYSAYTFNYYL